MADGPAGVRIAPKYGVDEKGPYSLDNGAFSEVLDLIPDEVIAALGFSREMLNEKRSGTVYEQYCTAIPIGTALAQSWNPAVCEACADLVALEMERFGIHIWLAPAMNIHRLPLCGRNFEYYSEDPLISGKMAAAITKGIQKHPGRLFPSSISAATIRRQTGCTPIRWSASGRFGTSTCGAPHRH